MSGDLKLQSLTTVLLRILGLTIVCFSAPPAFTNLLNAYFSSLPLGMNETDMHLHDTYYVVYHFHFSVVSVILGVLIIFLSGPLARLICKGIREDT
jgi:heme/copper-type cytochrome/quinol oxidase subunit 1